MQTATANGNHAQRILNTPSILDTVLNTPSPKKSNVNILLNPPKSKIQAIMGAISSIAGEQFNKSFGLNFSGATSGEVNWAFNGRNITREAVVAWLKDKWGKIPDARIDFKNNQDFATTKHFAKNEVKNSFGQGFDSNSILPQVLAATNTNSSDNFDRERLVAIIKSAGLQNIKDIILEIEKEEVEEQRKEKLENQLRVEMEAFMQKRRKELGL